MTASRRGREGRGAGEGGVGNTSAGSVVEWNVPEAKVFFNDLATDKPLPKNLITGASVAGTRSVRRVTALHALGHGGYEFKTKAPMSVHVYIYMNLHGIDALPTVFARFAAIRLSGPQPEVTWTLMRILDRAGVMASR